MVTMKIQEMVYRMILDTIPKVPPETGGILGCRKDRVICDFSFDSGIGHKEGMEYVPDIQEINRHIELWRQGGVEFCGMIHSHPPGVETLSLEDKAYICRIFAAAPITVRRLYFPILIPREKMIPFVAIRKDDGVIIQREPIELLMGGEPNGRKECTN